MEEERAQRVLAAIQEQISDFDALVKEGAPDGLPRWVRATASLLANEVDPEEAEDFKRAGRMTQLPAFGQRYSPFKLASRQRRFLERLQSDIAKSPSKYLRPK